MSFEHEDRDIRRCQEGDVGAFERIYQCYSQKMMSVACRMLGNEQDAEDVLQEAFVKCYRGIGQFRFGASFSTWLCRIVINTCYDWMKKRKRSETIPLDRTGEPSHNPETELRIHINDAIAALPPKMRACFVLYAMEGYRQREIATILDTQEGTVKAHVFEAKFRLREALGTRMRGIRGHDL